jgi:hypothetical protein
MDPMDKLRSQITDAGHKEQPDTEDAQPLEPIFEKAVVSNIPEEEPELIPDNYMQGALEHIQELQNHGMSVGETDGEEGEL